MTQSARSPITIVRAFYGFVLFGAFLFAAVAVFLVFDRGQALRDSALESAVSVRGQHAAYDLARSLHIGWRHLAPIADSAALATDPEALRAVLGVIRGDGQRVVWAGIARPDGVVHVASGGVLEGEDVTQQLWFHRGMLGEYAGDVRTAPPGVASGVAEPGNAAVIPRLQVLDLAMPIGGGAQPAGVLAIQVDFAWVSNYLTESARSLDLDLFLLARDGTVIAASRELATGHLDLASMRAAATGASVSLLETWPDGEQYFTTVVPRVAYGDLPPPGWRMVARISPDAVSGFVEDSARIVVVVVLVAGSAVLLLSMAFVYLFLAPVGAFARNAVKIADGKDVYPKETRRTTELAQFSVALARIQSRLRERG